MQRGIQYPFAEPRFRARCAGRGVFPTHMSPKNELNTPCAVKMDADWIFVFPHPTHSPRMHRIRGLFVVMLADTRVGMEPRPYNV